MSKKSSVSIVFIFSTHGFFWYSGLIEKAFKVEFPTGVSKAANKQYKAILPRLVDAAFDVLQQQFWSSRDVTNTGKDISLLVLDVIALVVFVPDVAGFLRAYVRSMVVTGFAIATYEGGPASFSILIVSESGLPKRRVFQAKQLLFPFPSSFASGLLHRQ